MTKGSALSPIIGYVSDKIQGHHRDRQAIVYVRQSTVQQLERHQESTRLQYALADRAFQFGWPRIGITVIDDDLGRSGASIEGRPGFQRLVAEVGLGHVGLVLGVEMSRLARSCRDWHQLLEICGLFDTLIADADGVYDPGNHNDRLLLGLKGTMSEAELHILKARMLEGRRAKARRGELGKAVPMGYVRRPSGEVAFDPDEQAQAVIRLVFDLFERFKTAGKVMRYLIDHDVRLPVRAKGGLTKGELEWHRINRVSLLNLFRNPIYAGAYVYGMRSIDRKRQKPGRPGTGRKSNRSDEADVLIRDRLPAYISWDQYQRNQSQLQSNLPENVGSIRTGAALLSGLLICGRCGLRMNVQYTNNGYDARYICNRMAVEYGEIVCQSVKAAPIDNLIGLLILDALKPAALEASLTVAADLEAERTAINMQWHHRLERANLEVARARRQYDVVEPENRLVARTLERQWEEALTKHARLEAEFARYRQEQPQALTPSEMKIIRALASNLPDVWEAGRHEDRQTIIRLLLERILVEVVGDSEQVRCQCHWHGGQKTSHNLIRPVRCLRQLSTYPALIARATELHRTGMSYPEIAGTLNSEGWRPAKRRDTFTASMVYNLLVKTGTTTAKCHGSWNPAERSADEWTIGELAARLGIPKSTLYTWIQRRCLRSRTVPARGSRPIILIEANEATVAKLQEIRATPPPWRRLPTPITTTTDHPQK